MADASPLVDDDSHHALFHALDVPCCIVEVNSGDDAVNYRYVEVNRAFLTQCVLGDVTGRWATELTIGRDPRLLELYRDVATRGGGACDSQQMDLFHDRWFDLHVFRISGGSRSRLGVLFTDITARKHAEEALYESEAKFRALATQTEVGFTLLDGSGHLVYVNDRQCAMLQRSRHELLGQQLQDVIGDAAWQQHCAAFETMRTGGAPLTIELAHGAANGRRRCMRMTFSARLDGHGHIVGVLVVSFDITERVAAELELRRAHDLLEERVAERTRQLASEVADRRTAEYRVRALISRVLTTQESERRRIAQELHDNLGQQLTALHLKLETLRREAVVDTRWQGRFREAQSYLAHFERDLDVFTSQLRPAGLYSLGLVNALTDLVNDWSTTCGIAAQLHVIGLDTRRLAARTETNLYRLAQEALNNVAKHAAARRVALILQRRDDSIVMSIEDDGRGFDTAVAHGPDESGMGLTGIRERAMLLGGAAEIESAPGAGSTIIVTVPAVFQPPEP
jgi:PAS domain S-box-containing protein